MNTSTETRGKPHVVRGKVMALPARRPLKGYKALRVSVSFDDAQFDALRTYARNDQLRAFIERIERMEEEKAAIAADIKEIYAEAKGNGFDTKIMRRVVNIRKQDANERLEQEALLEMYMAALGMVAAPPEE